MYARWDDPKMAKMARCHENTQGPKAKSPWERTSHQPEPENQTQTQTQTSLVSPSFSPWTLERKNWHGHYSAVNPLGRWKNLKLAWLLRCAVLCCAVLRLRCATGIARPILYFFFFLPRALAKKLVVVVTPYLSGLCLALACVYVRASFWKISLPWPCEMY